MMSVFEYAMDVEKTVEEILKKCKELQIDATNEEDMLDEDAITELDNVLAQEPAEEDYDEIDEIEDALIEKEKNKIEGLNPSAKQKKLNTTNVKSTKKELARKKKEMYKHKEKLMNNAQEDNVVLYKEGMSVQVLADVLGVNGSELVMKIMGLGLMLSLNNPIDYETASLLVMDYNKTLKKEETQDVSNFEEYEIVDNEADLEVKLKELEEKGIARDSLSMQRYKGLGEMDSEQLWETTMNPETRTLVQVHLEDAIKADQIFSVLMGENVEPRREFIEQNAKYVTNLDV